jgi:uncharacterized 2Fe-2S/4Fe-4S cluster protein (DUF4445 family)
VGADAAAVALSEAPGAQTELTLVVDVGTNAEILLGDTEGVLACSSPTGPAFEGAQISSGQRAAPGAIERVEIDPDTKEPRFKVIGSDLWSTDPGFAEATKDTGVTGICGSGIIEAVAEMRMAGLLDASGLIGSAEATGSPAASPTGRTHAYLLHDGSGGGRAAHPRDAGRHPRHPAGEIRALRRRAAPDGQARRRPGGPRGAGRGLRRAYQPETRHGAGHDPRCRWTRSPAPATPPAHGARMALCNRAAREEIEKTVRRIEKIETAVEPRFQEHFVNANAIPHAVDPFPELAKVATLPAVAFGASGAQPGDGGGRRRRRRA